MIIEARQKPMRRQKTSLTAFILGYVRLQPTNIVIFLSFLFLFLKLSDFNSPAENTVIRNDLTTCDFIRQEAIYQYCIVSMSDYFPFCLAYQLFTSHNPVLVSMFNIDCLATSIVPCLTTT
jgi:hypothetical protein